MAVRRRHLAHAALGVLAILLGLDIGTATVGEPTAILIAAGLCLALPACTAEPAAPVLGSGAPQTTRASRACKAACAHIRVDKPPSEPVMRRLNEHPNILAVEMMQVD